VGLVFVTAHKILLGKSEAKRPLGTRRRSFEVNIKMDLKNGGEVVDWI
jgi:hypothetical protein